MYLRVSHLFQMFLWSIFLPKEKEVTREAARRPLTAGFVAMILEALCNLSKLAQDSFVVLYSCFPDIYKSLKNPQKII